MEGIASLVPLILVFLIMYFLLIRPQQKKLKEHQAMVAALLGESPSTLYDVPRIRDVEIVRGLLVHTD